MIKKGNRVRHKDSKIDQQKGIMMVFSVKNELAICGAEVYPHLGYDQEIYLIHDLKIA